MVMTNDGYFDSSADTSVYSQNTKDCDRHSDGNDNNAKKHRAITIATPIMQTITTNHMSNANKAITVTVVTTRMTAMSATWQ